MLALSPCVRTEALRLLPGASAKSPSPPGNTSNRNGTSLPPCPITWWHFPDYPSPGATLRTPPLISWTRPLWALHRADSTAWSVARCCRRSIHSASCVSVPANPLSGVRTPAAPHTLCFLSPPCQLVCSMILPSADWLHDTLRREGQEGTCSIQVASFSSSRQQIRWCLPLPPPVHQHLCHLLSLGPGENSSHSSSCMGHPWLSSHTALAAAIPALWTGEQERHTGHH